MLVQWIDRGSEVILDITHNYYVVAEIFIPSPPSSPLHPSLSPPISSQGSSGTGLENVRRIIKYLEAV